MWIFFPMRLVFVGATIRFFGCDVSTVLGFLTGGGGGVFLVGDVGLTSPSAAAAFTVTVKSDFVSPLARGFTDVTATPADPFRESGFVGLVARSASDLATAVFRPGSWGGGSFGSGGASLLMTKSSRFSPCRACLKTSWALPKDNSRKQFVWFADAQLYAKKPKKHWMMQTTHFVKSTSMRLVPLISMTRSLTFRRPSL